MIGEGPKELDATLKKLNIKLTSKELHLDPKPLLKVVMSRFLGENLEYSKHGLTLVLGYPRGLVDMWIRNTPNPLEGARHLLPTSYSGNLGTPIGNNMLTGMSTGPLMIHVVKLYNSPDGAKFLALGRVFSGKT